MSKKSREHSTPRSKLQVRIRLTTDFLEAWLGLHRDYQPKVIEFLYKFLTNPRSSAINYEKLTGTKDERVHSARVDQAYRVIVIPSESGNLYWLAFVAREPEAYAWAETHIQHQLG